MRFLKAGSIVPWKRSEKRRRAPRESSPTLSRALALNHLLNLNLYLTLARRLITISLRPCRLGNHRRCHETAVDDEPLQAGAPRPSHERVHFLCLDPTLLSRAMSELFRF